MIKITEKYYIEVDTSCYTVYERKVVQSGKNAGNELFQNATFYGSFHMALDNIIQRMTSDELKSESIIELKDAVAKIQKLREEIMAIAYDLQHVGSEVND